MTNLDWPSAMDALLRSTSDLGDAWEAVEFRFLLGPAHSGFVVPEGAYFEPTIEPLPGDLRVAFETPLLLQGRMSVKQFVCPPSNPCRFPLADVARADSQRVC